MNNSFEQSPSESKESASTESLALLMMIYLFNIL